ncbi:CLUMA_CG012356, isoform A [Clunio marinus]|uniref:CLUMA_CG012356, isoform A n=1 Tax=Clunio marinus TaxID=568069 RepID=A0A1J1IGH2_9DIPT|nr:CLUMA_CG012356, isoform A [Clunio marinus]
MTLKEVHEIIMKLSLVERMSKEKFSKQIHAACVGVMKQTFVWLMMKSLVMIIFTKNVADDTLYEHLTRTLITNDVTLNK